MAAYETLADVVGWLKRLQTTVSDLGVQVSSLTARPAVHGSVNGANGAKLRGVGFTSSRSGTGVYVITFDAPLQDDPSPTFGLFANGSVMGINHTARSPSAMTISTYRSDTGAATDCSFSFHIEQ